MALWGKVDQAADKPKYLNTADKAATVGVDVAEATTPANINKGINSPGWVKYSTYTDGQGATRHKSEVLVAFSSMSGEASDDSVAVDPVIAIGTQPQAVSVTSPEDLVFTVVATVNNGATPTYQWQVSDDAGSTWANITGATAATLTVEDSDAEYVTANEFRVVVSSTTAADVTSNAVAATIA
jgi:hypothetical protein